jgi:hypothetical protein
VFHSCRLALSLSRAFAWQSSALTAHSPGARVGFLFHLPPKIIKECHLPHTFLPRRLFALNFKGYLRQWYHRHLRVIPSRSAAPKLAEVFVEMTLDYFVSVLFFFLGRPAD